MIFAIAVGIGLLAIIAMHLVAFSMNDELNWEGIRRYFKSILRL